MRNVFTFKSLLLPLACLACVTLSIHSGAQENSEVQRKNWFNDPFFQISTGIANCPAPLGPMITEAERNAEAHYRVERGTSCWMEGKCSKPNSYLYDTPIAKALREKFDDTHDFDGTSLWLTVQRRFVIVQGCITQMQQADAIEAMIRSVPDVERVIMQVQFSPYDNPPYPLADMQKH